MAGVCHRDSKNRHTVHFRLLFLHFVSYAVSLLIELDGSQCELW